MLYGVLMYENSKNIGDDIQSYAAAQFLPRVDCVVDREHLSLFRAEYNKRVAVIMNGWYFIRKFNWPPSPDIVPYYTSMHFNQEDYFGINTSFLDGIGADALRAFAPIGCRDDETFNLLSEKHIDGYLSGCLTLTLPRKFAEETVVPYACLTNVSDEVFAFVKSACPELDLRQISHEPAIEEGSSIQERFANVEALLTQYQNAKFVVTTRLHCALPCLALGTPVLLITNHAIYEEGRFSGLYDLLHHCKEDVFLKGLSDFSLTTPPENSTAYQKLSEQLSRGCRAFISRCESGNYPAAFVVDPFEKEKWLSSLLEEAQNRVNQRFAELYDYLDKLNAGKNWLEQHSDDQERWIAHLNDVIAEKDQLLADKDLLLAALVPHPDEEDPNNRIERD